MNTPAQYPRCSETLRAAGKAYPRTCQECGLGPCKRDRSTQLDKLPRDFVDARDVRSGVMHKSSMGRGQ